MNFDSYTSTRRSLRAGAQCPLCEAHAHAFVTVDGRRYLRCPRCLLTFLHPAQRLSHEAEHARYLTHRNDPDDPGYRAFLDRVATPLGERLAPGAEGLDYGSGPGPTLSVMLAERGFPTADFDPFFAADPAPLQRKWDFVTCTETAEHFFHPGAEFARLHQLLRPGGLLAVMTRPLDDDAGFAEWWYRRDPTHVAFYRPETFRWIEGRWPWTLESPAPTVFLFRRPAAPLSPTPGVH